MRIKAYFEITLGTFFVSIGFYFFYAPIMLVAGGVNGISLILERFIDPHILIYIFNISFLFVGLFVLGKNFFLKTCYGAILYPTFLMVFKLLGIDNNAIILNVDNKLIICAIMGSILTGVGTGLALKYGGSTGGMDIPQKIISKTSGFPFSWVMYFTDGVIILIGIVFFGIEKGFFAIFAMLISGYFIDIISIGGIAKRSTYIITSKPLEIKESLFIHIKRGVTEFDVHGGYTNDKRKMLMCIMGINDYYKIKQIIEAIDSNAFMFVVKTNEVIGEGFRNG